MMKKFVSIALALVMLLTVAVPAFAATDITTAPSAADVIVKTNTDTDGDGKDDTGSISVQIPADTTIAWGAAKTDISWKAEAHLTRDRFLKVDVTAQNGKLLTADKKFEIAYALEGTTAFRAENPWVYGTTESPMVEMPLFVTVPESAWKTAVVESYSDTVHFAVSVVDAQGVVQ